MLPSGSGDGDGRAGRGDDRVISLLDGRKHGRHVLHAKSEQRRAGIGVLGTAGMAIDARELRQLKSEAPRSASLKVASRKDTPGELVSAGTPGLGNGRGSAFSPKTSL